MDLPSALDIALKALLGSYSVSSWRIAAESQNPIVILRLRPLPLQSACQNGLPVPANTVLFRKKSPSQIRRDKQRTEQFRHRTDRVANSEIVREVSVDKSAFRENEEGVKQRESQCEGGDSASFSKWQ